MHYPTSISEINQWASSHRRHLSEARDRFIQYAILWALAGSPSLSSTIVFKGGNALDFAWNHVRSTTDLDFSVDMTRYDPQTTISDLQHLIEIALPPT